MSRYIQPSLFADEDLYVLDDSTLSVSARAWAKKNNIYNLRDDMEMDTLLGFLETFKFSDVQLDKEIKAVELNGFNLSENITMLTYLKIMVDCHLTCSCTYSNIKSEITGLAYWETRR